MSQFQLDPSSFFKQRLCIWKTFVLPSEALAVPQQVGLSSKNLIFISFFTSVLMAEKSLFWTKWRFSRKNEMKQP